ncbi:hypothetical protein DPMN_073784 [Dreissena polymorpha]|uniref:5'-Nucleotidase C-terminal domain-containing protein n=1 Tax=Dreissena polymorpha TaxID=45954 RepID=A0A9D4HBM5_DREPO|nr:hypothetical protein DPMN_073784 [Dreissena polymorpha]
MKLHRNQLIYLLPIHHQGNITTGNTHTVQPFQNEVDLIRVTGANLREPLEWSVGEYNPVDAHGRFMQFSGNHLMVF